MTEQAADAAPASVADNIDKIFRGEADAMERRTRGEVVIHAIGGFFGTRTFVASQIVISAAWVAWNSAGALAALAFDRFPFPLLSSVTSFEAVLIAALVLVKQNRISVTVDRRDHLDLQVNLRTERQATQIIQMLNRLSVRLGVDHDHDAEGHELGQHVEIGHVVDELHRRLPDTQRG